MKIFFVDIVCFLLVAAISFGICYAYLSDKAEVKGSSTTAQVSVQYQYSIDGKYISVSEVFAKVNGGAEQKVEGTVITPGDTFTIVGRAVNTSNVAVYVLAKLEIVSSKGTDVLWYNIGTNDPTIVNGVQTGVDTPEALATGDYKTLYMNETTKVYQVGAGSLGAGKYKELAIPYTFDGETYENGDTITSVTLTLHVHQKNHLRTATDFGLYSQYETNGQINGYDTESIYAAHYITGNKKQA